MRVAALPSDEAARLEALADYQLLDTADESAFDAFARLGCEIASTRMAAISLVDENRQWFKARVGFAVKETPRSLSFCSHVVATGRELIVRNAGADECFCDNPLVAGDSHVRFYAGIPLRDPHGHTLGTLCVMDTEPRALSPEQLGALRTLAGVLVDVLDNRHRMLALLEAGRVDLLTIDPRTQTIVFASRGACARLGYSLKEAIGMPVREVMPSMDERMLRELMAGDERGGEIVRESELVRRDGSAYPVELRVDVAREGGEQRVRALALDLTPRRAQQREIELLLGAMNVAGDVILVYEVRGDGALSLSYANDAFTLQTGYTRAEALGRDLQSFRKAMPDDEGMRRVRETLAAGEPTQAEVASYRRDGSTYWNQVSLHPIRGTGGALTHWISIERDISEEVERTTTLAEEHDRLLSLTRAARTLFQTLDASSIVTTVREVALQLLRSEARVLAVNDDGAGVAVERLGEIDWERVTLDPLVERAVSGRIRVDDERIGRALVYAGRFAGARYVLELRSRHGRPLRKTDVFVFDLVAEYFAVALRNVALYYEVEERRSSVLELNQTKSDLIAMLAHDFRGPLTSIVGFSDLMAEVGAVNDEQREFLAAIRSSAMQLSDLASDTLTLSRLERNEVVLQLGEADVGALVASVVAQQKERRSIDLRIDGDARIVADGERLRQVFTNLIDNAIKYAPAGPDPQVLVAGETDTVTVVVRDFGIGIPAGERSHIFDRFSRASNARKLRISGPGFGLYLTKQLVHLHGGTIAVDSEEGRGSTFTVTLPRHVDRRGAPRAVLLFDPERDASYLAYGLQEAGYRVHAVSTVEEALGIADAVPFDAVLLAAPESLSADAAARFRAFSCERSVPLIAIGAEGSPRLAAAMTLMRPAAIGDVAAALERLLASS